MAEVSVVGGMQARRGGSVTDLTDNGIVNGDPSPASPEAGCRIAEHTVTTSADFMVALRDAPCPPGKETA